MKFLRTLLLPLLSILLASGNQVLIKLDNPLLGVSSNVKHTAKTDGNAGVWSKPGAGGSASHVPYKIAKATQKIANGEYSITQTVANNIRTRPYINSPSTIKNIITSSKGIPDKAFKGGLNWKVPGEFKGSKGIYELGMNPETGVIYHFLFKTSK